MLSIVLQNGLWSHISFIFFVYDVPFFLAGLQATVKVCDLIELRRTNENAEEIAL